MNVTAADSIVMPIGTEKEIKVSDVMKYASISQPMLDAIQGGITQKAQDADADVAFARFEVGHQHADEKGGLRPVNGTLIMGLRARTMTLTLTTNPTKT